MITQVRLQRLLRPVEPVACVAEAGDDEAVLVESTVDGGAHDLHAGMHRAHVLDPMLATGRSSAAAVTSVKNAGARSVLLVCLVAAPEGIDHMRSEHPDVEIVCAAIDRELNENGFIVPGLGDAGDRLYGTK